MKPKMHTKQFFIFLTFILLFVDKFFSFVNAKPKDESTTQAGPTIKNSHRKIVEDDDDDEEIAYDPDEFDGIEKFNQKKIPEEKPKKIEKGFKTTNDRVNEFDDYSIGGLIFKFWMEILVIFFLIGYGINFILGKKKNAVLVESWAKKNRELFEQNFALVGVDEKGHMILKESNSVFKCYCSGRINCESLMAVVELQKRHDLVFYAIEMFSNGRDILTIDVEMNDVDMEPFVFAIVSKREEKQLRKDLKDLNSMFTQNYTNIVPNFPKKLVILSELEEIIPAIITNEVLATIIKYEQYFIKMHFTDQNPYNTKTKKKLLRFVYALPAITELEQLSTLMKMAIYFIDQVPKLYFSAQNKKTIEKNRMLAQEKLLKETHSQRQEAAQQRKIDKKQKEEEQKSQVPLTKEELKRREEKERKKELKKKQSKIKVVVG